MATFTKYMHLERFGNTEVDGIADGKCYVFPKLDGTNAHVWLGEDGNICAGSRNRELSTGSDNAGFYNYVKDDARLSTYLNLNKHHILYGEWLVPHSIKNYREDAWRKFYVFDVYDTVSQQWMPYEEYKDELESHGLNYLTPIAIIKNGTYEHFTKCLEKATFAMVDGAGAGEGIVLKNYGFVNRFGNTVWAKIVSNEFKEKHAAAMGVAEIGHDLIEEKIVAEFVTQSLVDKVEAKIVLQEDGWHSKCIPQLLSTVFYDLVKEEMWEIVKKHKMPRINFKELQRYTTLRVKELKKELF